MSVQSTKRHEQKLMFKAKLRLYLMGGQRLAADMAAHMGVTQNCVTKWCREERWPDGRAFISGWVFCEESFRWKALRSFGQQEDVPPPKRISMAESGKRYRDKLRQDPVRKAKIRATQRMHEQLAKGRKNAKARAKNAEAARERSEMEEMYGRRDFAHIKPHVDPWACLMHGGAAMLAGVAA